MRSSRRTIVRAAWMVTWIGVVLASAEARAAGECREECWEARRVCQAAARASHRACTNRCEASIEDAAERARALCRERELGPRACMRVILYAVRQAATGCREDCGQVLARARAFCNEERLECHDACTGPLDPGCANQCLDDFAVCREELGGCTDACEAQAETALESCRDRLDDRVAFLRCLRAVRRDTSLCREACHEESPCGRELRPCLAECATQP